MMPRDLHDTKGFQTKKKRREKGKRKIRLAPGAVLGVWLWLCWLNLMQAFAAEGAVHFGSESYVWVKGDVCPLGVYFDGSIAVNSYSVCLEYDPAALEYLDGADRIEGNLLWVEGGGGETGYKRMLHFRPLEEGDTMVRMVSAGGVGTVNGEDGTATEEEFTIGQLAQAPVNVRKRGSSRLLGLEVGLAEGMEEFSPDVLEYHMQAGYEVEQLEIGYETEEEGAGVSLSGTELAVGSNVITLTVQGEQAEPVVYTLYVERAGKPTAAVTEKEETGSGNGGTAPVGSVENGETENRKGTGMKEGAEGDVPGNAGAGNKGSAEDLEKDIGGIEEDASGNAETGGGDRGIFGNADGSIDGGSREADGFQDTAPDNRKDNEEDDGLKPELLAALLAVSGMAVLYGSAQIRKIKKKKKPAEKKKKRKKSSLKMINLEKKVIEVRHVSMDFRMAQDESSSLKEYVIRTLKRQNHYRMLHALHDVSFEVKQGEVVGIIGTNGSGKSTLLKIIAGALLPTEGEVIVDKRKVQILTLGTGFDMELTARENVYLNGAIIGYSKEFIDDKFEDIVAFAELEGFMDERMKNFSSGMVSRLGFAIATVRDSADILILDEVLSVGDMFFREKSEARIREMIHSGSTVLIVSHSSGVIRKNCDTAVWIEKGVLQMVGKPEAVCGAYEKMGREGESAPA